MKVLINFLLLSGFLLLAAYRLQPRAGAVHITIHAIAGKTQPVKLTTPNVFTMEPTPLADTQLDVNGTAVLELSLTKPLFLDLKVGDKSSTLLLSPGDNLHVTLDSKLVDKPFSYSGKGAESATYLSQSTLVFRQYEQRDGKHMLQLDPKAFVSRVDSAQKALDQFDQQYIRRFSLPKSIQQLLQARNNMRLLSYKLNYALAQYDPNDPSAELLPPLKNATNEVPFESRFLDANMVDYAFVLTFYTQTGLYAPLSKSKTKAELISLQEQLPVLVDQQITQKNFPALVRTFLRSKNLLTILSVKGITPVTDSLVADIKKEPGYAAYDPAIAQKYAQWVALGPGKPAPDFSGTTPEGKALALSNLRGKVVYVDTWATWCVPCREEFPQAKQLQSHFADNDKVTFLYVSIDRNQDAWKKLLESDPDFKGMHMNLPPGESFDTFWKAYQLSGIPRYLLIDQDGKLVSANAARPSSGKVEADIQRLLR